MKLSVSFFAAAIACTSLAVQAQSGKNPVDISNVLRVEYDDNVFSTGSGASSEKVDSFKIIEQLELLFDTDKGSTYFGFVYSPSFIYYTDRPSDDTDLDHMLDASFIYRISPTQTLQLKDTFRVSEEPEVIQDDVQVRNNNDFIYNSINANYTVAVKPERLTVRVDGRYAVTRYDVDEVADASDYDQATAGLDLVYTLAENTSATGQFRYSVLDYEDGFRDSDAIQAGLGLTKIFSPALQGEMRVGYETRDLDDAIEQDADSPFVDASLIYLAAQNTQVTVGGGYSLDRSPVLIFAQQERTRVYLNANHALSPAVKLNLNSSYSMGTFNSDDATSAFDPAVNTDGDETIVRLSVGLSYSINVRNAIRASYSYTELESDVRPSSDFDRNRISLGWQYTL